MRDKLIRLLQDARELAKDACEKRKCPVCYKGENCVDGMIADHLIANGVTIQRWIPVKERLPERTSDYMVYLSTPMDGKQVPIGRGVATYITADECWAIHYPYIVTHWIPMPDPPKEVE